MKYTKRIHWDRHRPEFLKIGFIFALAITFTAFNYTSSTPIYNPLGEEPMPEVLLIVPPPTIQKKDSPPPPPRPPKIKTVVNIEPVTEPIIAFEPKVDLPEDVKTEIDEFANDPTPEPAPKVEILVKESEPDDSPVLMAERMPVYGDCSLDSEELIRRECTSIHLRKHTYANIKYPAMAREYGVEGTVVVSFIVNKNGDVKDIEIVKDIGMGCGEEVIKAVKKLGKFVPGKQNGRPVAVIYRMPVHFKLR